MSDIPIGTPPSPPGRHAAPGGWYPDPIDAAQERYWDGWQWSRNTRPREAQPGAHPHPGQRPEGQQHYGGQQYGGHQTTNPWGTPGQQPPTGDPGQPSGQGQYGQQYPGQPHAGQQPPGQGYAGPGYPGANYPGANYPGANYPGANYPQGPTAPRAAPLGGASQATSTADGVPLSGWWWRVLAAWLDSVFVALLVAIPAFPIYSRMAGAFAAYFQEVIRAAEAGQTQQPPQPDLTTFISAGDQALLLGLQIGIALLYTIVFLRVKSATPGKLICGLRVVPVDQGQASGRLAWNSVVVRALIWVLPSVSSFLLVVRLIDGLFPLWNPKRQALHDLAAKTQVVRPATRQNPPVPPAQLTR